VLGGLFNHESIKYNCNSERTHSCVCTDAHMDLYKNIIIRPKISKQVQIYLSGNSVFIVESKYFLNLKCNWIKISYNF
jgi:hypothetical protein